MVQLTRRVFLGAVLSGVSISGLPSLAHGSRTGFVCRKISLAIKLNNRGGTPAATPIDFANDRILDFAGVELIDGEITGRYIYVPHAPKDDFSNPLSFSRAVGEIARFIRDARTITFNGDFDIRFVNAEMTRSGLPHLMSPNVNLVSRFRRRWPEFPCHGNEMSKKLNTGPMVTGLPVPDGVLHEAFDIATCYQKLRG